MPHEEYIERVFRELQGDLSADDARSLESHLANCPDCSREVKSLRDSAASLAYVVAPVEAPKEIRDRLLQRVAALKSEASNSSNQQPSNVVPLIGRSKNSKSAYFSRSAAFSAAIAASLVIAALIIALIYLWSRNQSLRAELSQTYGRLSQVEGELEQVRDERFILTAAASKIRPLEGTPVAPRANALLSYDRDTGRALLYVNNLPQAPVGKAYQL
ncbi:MAG: anti-sigma factor [Pyrinomonadaceae bacterium]